MAKLVTTKAVITCPHQGRVTLLPTQTKVLAEGGPVLCEPDLVKAPIVGCTQPASMSSKPCTQVVSVTPDSVSRSVRVGTNGVYLSTLTGITDGVPLATVSVSNPGQQTVEA